jgi:hypothetical protein
MKTENSGKQKLPFTRKLFFFMLGILALVGMSSIVSKWIPPQGANNRIGIIDIKGLIQDSQVVIKQIKKFREDKRHQEN